MKYFSYFSQKIGIDISCKLSPFCMKCQSFFSGKSKNINLPSAEFAQRVVRVKMLTQIPEQKLQVTDVP